VPREALALRGRGEGRAGAGYGGAARVKAVGVVDWFGVGLRRGAGLVRGKLGGVWWGG